MKIKYSFIVACMLGGHLLIAQDPYVFSQISNTQITQQDSNVIVSNIGEPFGGIYAQNGLIISFEPFPFLAFGEVSTATPQLAPITDLKVYPNPVLYTATLEREDASDLYMVRIGDAQGRVLSEERWEAGSTMMQLTFANYTSGIYFLSIVDETQPKASQFKMVKR